MTIFTREGERAGCKEVLFSLGEKPELRYLKARNRLAELGYSRMTDYLRDMCAWVLEETSLVPHVNAGSLSADEVAARGIKSLPPTLLHAADNLSRDDTLAEGLGMTADGPYRDYFVSVKRDEFTAHHHQVTPGEIDQYLTLF